MTREITIIPRRGWGGEGALGCILGYGALHRLPAPLTEPLNSPGEAMFDVTDMPTYPQHVQQAPPFLPVPSASESIQDFVPAQVMASSEEAHRPGPPMFNPLQVSLDVPTKKTTSRFKSRPGLSQMQSTDFMDSYMQEEETKSKANDYTTDDVTTPQTGRVVAPHPKSTPLPYAGGPPPRARNVTPSGVDQKSEK